MFRRVKSFPWEGWENPDLQTSGECITTSPFRANDFRTSRRRGTIPPSRPSSVPFPSLFHFLQCPRPLLCRANSIGGNADGGCRVARNAEFVPPYGLGASMYIRPLLLGTGPELGLVPPEEFTFVVFVTPGASSPSYDRNIYSWIVGNYYSGGIKPVDALILEDFDRGSSPPLPSLVSQPVCRS